MNNILSRVGVMEDEEVTNQSVKLSYILHAIAFVNLIRITSNVLYLYQLNVSLYPCFVN